MRDRSHDEAMAELFLANPAYAAELVAEVCAEGAVDELVVLMRQFSTGVASRDLASGDTNSQK